MRDYRTVVLSKNGEVEVIFNNYRTFSESLEAARILVRAGIDEKRVDIEKRIAPGHWVPWENEVDR